MTELGVITWVVADSDKRSKDMRWERGGHVLEIPENCVTFVCTVLVYVLGINTVIVVWTRVIQ
jgi:hypothetical protein